MICTLCRSTVADDALICPQCGDLAQSRVELGAAAPAGGSGALWIALGLLGFTLAMIAVIVAASGRPVDGGPICVVGLLLSALWAPGMLSQGRGRAWLSILFARRPRYGVRALAYLKRLRTEAVGVGSRRSLHHFATFDSLAEFNIEPEQYERLKGCEGQRMVITYIAEYHELVEAIPSPPPRR